MYLTHKLSNYQRTNQPLNLPSQIELAFKTDEEEEGYDQLIRKKKKNELEGKDEEVVFDKGNGKIETGSLFGNTLSQSSSFAYNWFKEINFDLNVQPKLQSLSIPVISNKEVWDKESDRGDYPEMQQKIYTSLAQRFWYRTTKPYKLGALWKKQYLQTQSTIQDSLTDLYIYPLSNSYQSPDGQYRLNLNYHNEPYSILRSYFTLISSEDSHYTLVECLLSPDQYQLLSQGKLVSINADLYYVASIDGYDPTGNLPTKLKLIRKV